MGNMCLKEPKQICLGHVWVLMSTMNPAVYPQNMQLAQHFNEFLCDGYRLSAEACEVRFPQVDSSRIIKPGTVGLSDGFGKVVIMTGVCVILHSLETWLFSIPYYFELSDLNMTLCLLKSNHMFLPSNN